MSLGSPLPLKSGKRDGSSILMRDFLRQAALRPEHIKVIARLENATGRDWTVADVLECDLETILGFKGVGETYVRYFAELQALMKRRSDEDVSWLEVSYSAREIYRWLRDGGYELNWVSLTTRERRALRRIETSSGSRAAASDIVEIAMRAPLQKTRGPVDQTAQRIVEEASRRMESGAEGVEGGSLLTPPTAPKVGPAEFCELMVGDIARFRDSIEELPREIFVCRFGVGRKPESLKAIGERRGRTRERIRQIEKDMIHLLTRCFSLSRAARERIGRENVQDDPAVRFAPLRAQFWGEGELYRFWEICVGIDASGHSEERLAKAAHESRLKLRSILCENPSPLSREFLAAELCRVHGMSGQKADELVSAGERVGQLLPDRGGLTPNRMTKRDAVSHLLAGRPNGLSWRRAADILERSGAFETPLRAGQPTQEFTHNPNLYLMGTGRYRHRRFLDLNGIDVKRILESIRRFISESGALSVNLQTARQNVSDCAALDYFVLRHLVSEYGAEAGLYFDGRSRSDSVAIAPDADRASQKRHVYDLIQRAGEPVPFAHISQGILARNESSARQMLDVLRKEGRIVRTQTSYYATPAVARTIYDYDGLAALLDGMLDRHRKMIDLRAAKEAYKAAAKQVGSGALFRMGAPLCFLYDYVRGEGPRRGWRVAHDLISRKPIPYSSLKEACLALRAPGGDAAEAVGAASARVALSRSARQVLIPRWVAKAEEKGS